MMDERTAVVAATLTFLADGWVSPEDQKDLQDTLDRMQSPVADWTCCPLCAEIVCDDHCPLYPVRDEAGLWIGSKGHTEGPMTAEGYPVICGNCGTHYPDDHFERPGTRLLLGPCCKKQAHASG